MARVGISLGSNLGDRIVHLRTAVERLAPLRCSDHLLLSPVFETEPVDCPEGSGAFYNAVVEIETTLPPLKLLAATQAIERSLGRPEVRTVNAPRTVDLDLLYYDDLTMMAPGLELPHPRMLLRAFVLKPLAAIRPDLVPAGALELVDDTGVTSATESLAV
jgi:2-amino-4-hydroxy-6-hydroxymethyldihydropteridine diphosphokinase